MFFVSSPGPAMGIAHITTRELVGKCFNKSYTMAVGIGGIGPSVGFVIFAPLVQFFLEIYGWRATMLLIGAIFSHLAVCGAFLKPQVTPEYYKEVNVSEDQGVVDDDATRTRSKDLCSYITSCCTSITDTFRLDLFTSVPYWLITFIYAMIVMTHTSWVIYFVPYMNVSKGYSLVDATNFVVVMGTGKILGNVIVGPVVGKSGLGSNVWMCISLLVTCVNYVVDPWLMSYWPIAVNVFIFGCFDSFLYNIFDVITKETIGVDQLGMALGWIGLKGGIFRFSFLFFPGMLFLKIFFVCLFVCCFYSSIYFVLSSGFCCYCDN